MQQARYLQLQQQQQQQQALRMQQQQSSGYVSPYHGGGGGGGGSNLGSPQLYHTMQPFPTPPLSSMLDMNDVRGDDMNGTDGGWSNRDMYRRQQGKTGKTDIDRNY